MRFRPPPVGRGDAPESECRLTRGGPPPPNRGHLQGAGLEQPGRQGDLEARSRVPATLVDTIFGAIADAGSIPAVSTVTRKARESGPSSFPSLAPSSRPSPATSDRASSPTSPGGVTPRWASRPSPGPRRPASGRGGPPAAA